VSPALAQHQNLESGVQIELGAATDKPMPSHLGRRLPFAQRLTCTVAGACEVTGLGRTKIYELIGNGRITTTTIGRRRLVIVQSLLALVSVNATPADWIGSRLLMTVKRTGVEIAWLHREAALSPESSGCASRLRPHTCRSCGGPSLEQCYTSMTKAPY
jgi:excisionase family DNA binding protein